MIPATTGIPRPCVRQAGVSERWPAFRMGFGFSGKRSAEQRKDMMLLGTSWDRKWHGLEVCAGNLGCFRHYFIHVCTFVGLRATCSSVKKGAVICTSLAVNC